MKKLNYREFLDKLNINIDYTYMKEYQESIKVNSDKEEFLNNLFLVPNITDSSRTGIIEKFYKNQLNDESVNTLSLKIEKIFNDFDDDINDPKIKIREYSKHITKYFNKENMEKLFKSNIENIDFIFYIIYAKYSDLEYSDVIDFINIVIKNNIIKKDHAYYNDILLYKLISLKNINGKFAYLKNEETMKELCTIAQNLFGFETTRIYTLLECKLVSKDPDGFKQLFYKHLDTMKRWDIKHLLDIFELVVYSKDEDIFKSMNQLLLNKDIKMLKGNELDIYNFLFFVENNNKDKIELYKNKLIKNEIYSFAHYDFFKNH